MNSFNLWQRCVLPVLHIKNWALDLTRMSICGDRKVRRTGDPPLAWWWSHLEKNVKYLINISSLKRCLFIVQDAQEPPSCIAIFFTTSHSLFSVLDYQPSWNLSRSLGAITRCFGSGSPSSRRCVSLSLSHLCVGGLSPSMCLQRCESRVDLLDILRNTFFIYVVDPSVIPSFSFSILVLSWTCVCKQHILRYNLSW